MMDKLKRLLNVKGWLEDILISKVTVKATTAAVAAAVGLLASPKTAVIIQSVTDFLPKLVPFGIDIKLDPQKIATVGVAFVAGGFISWFKRKVWKGTDATNSASV